MFTPDRLTNAFILDRGVKQGDALSTALFIIALDHIIKANNLKGLIINKL